MNKGHTTIVCEALWGDSAKGKVSNYITFRNNIDIVARAGTGTNMGHSMYVEGKCVKTNQFGLAGLIGTLNGNYPISVIGSGVVFDPIKARREISEYNMQKYHVDKLCSIITDEHKQREATSENYSESHSGSTKSGSGESRVDRVKRIGKLIRDDNNLCTEFNAINVAKFLNESYIEGKKILIEGSQSHYLSLYLSEEYPVTTSDNCTSTAFADDVGLAWNRIDDVCMVIKSAPTRVSQNCGLLPGEISKEEITKLSIQEYGVTSGRPRRKSLTIPFDLLYEPILVNSPTYFALTFCDHIDIGAFNQKHPAIITKDYIKEHFPKTYSNIIELEKRFNIPVKYIEYGKEWNYISEVKYE